MISHLNRLDEQLCPECENTSFEDFKQNTDHSELEILSTLIEETSERVKIAQDYDQTVEVQQTTAKFAYYDIQFDLCDQFTNMGFSDKVRDFVHKYTFLY